LTAATLKLYFDEDVHPSVARILGQRGFDVLTTQEADMLGRSDEEQLDFSNRQGRALLTFNVADFVTHFRTWAEKGKPHAGIIVSNQVRPGELLRRILRCLARYGEEGLANRLVWLHDFKRDK